jgi:hypothetical protein
MFIGIVTEEEQGAVRHMACLDELPLQDLVDELLCPTHRTGPLRSVNGFLPNL